MIFAAILIFLPAFSGGCKSSVTSLKGVKSLARKPGEGVYYSLFVRSFADSNGDGIGDLKGLTERLDYLNDGNDSTTGDLGINGIWLLPIFPSPSYHGYDVDDYYAINPEYGTMEDFENLISESKKRGINVMLDMTCNHSSKTNPWFTASKNPDDIHRDWYRWIYENEEGYNMHTQIFGHPLWNEDSSHPGFYYAGEFGEHMPDFNLESTEVRNEFKKIMRFWMEKGVSGFRYDAAFHIYDEIKYPLGTIEAIPMAVKWWKELTDFNRGINPESYSVGEVWDSSTVRASYAAGLGSTFHFNMGDKFIIPQIQTEQAGDNTYARVLQGDYDLLRERAPGSVDAPFLTNHDQARAAGLLKGDVAREKLAAAMYLLTEGVPFVYYGEEIGMMSGTRDESKRTPLLWNSLTEDGKPKDAMQTSWAQDSDCIYNKKTVSIAEQQKDKESLLTYYKRLIRLKTSRPSLLRGKFRAVELPFRTSKASSWMMEDEDESALVIHNLSAEENLQGPLPEGWTDARMIFATDSRSSADGQMDIAPLSTIVLLR